MKTAFLSSTARDLAEYRDAAYKAIEGLDDWHCVRMEDFGARDAMADEFCQETVAKCDVFVGIAGHCYGSSPKGSEKSYTEQEYDAAIATEKPRLMFLAPEDFPLPAYLIEPDERRANQRAFRDRVNAERIRAPFTSPDVLAWRVVQAIRNWERKATGIVQKLFKSRVRIVDKDLFQHPASEEELSQYYDGAQPLTWNIVAAQGIIERDQQAELLERLITPPGQTQMICIVGESGAGKSSLAWQLACELTHQQATQYCTFWTIQTTTFGIACPTFGHALSSHSMFWWTTSSAMKVFSEHLKYWTPICHWLFWQPHGLMSTVATRGFPSQSKG